MEKLVSNVRIRSITVCTHVASATRCLHVCRPKKQTCTIFFSSPTCTLMMNGSSTTIKKTKDQESEESMNAFTNRDTERETIDHTEIWKLGYETRRRRNGGQGRLVYASSQVNEDGASPLAFVPSIEPCAGRTSLSRLGAPASRGPSLM